MKHIGLLALVLSAACAPGPYYGSSSQPQYAQQTTTTQTASPDGTTTTETSTYAAAQPAAYEAPPPPPAAEEPAPASTAVRCHKKDTPDMCVGLTVMLEVGAIVKNHETASCRDASKALNRYADAHSHELEIFATLDKTHSQKQLAGFQKRHEGEAALVMNAALALDTRCEGDQKLDRALQRVGFSGMIGSPVL